MAIYAVAFPRVLALMALAAMSTMAVALTAGGEAVIPVRHEIAAPAPAGTPVLVVPDVRGQAHVFAKVMLEESGLAWRIRGPVQGYASNVVTRQYPEPGAEILDSGQPTIVLELERVPGRELLGRPENRSAYAGSPAFVVTRELSSPDRLGALR